MKGSIIGKIVLYTEYVEFLIKGLYFERTEQINDCFYFKMEKTFHNEAI